MATETQSETPMSCSSFLTAPAVLTMASASSVVGKRSPGCRASIRLLISASWNEGRKKARDYLCDYYTPADKMYIPLIGVIMRSNAKICIVPIQDYLGLDNKSRMNTPSSVGNNWRWRVDSKVLNKTFAKEIKAITVRYERCN